MKSENVNNVANGKERWYIRKTDHAIVDNYGDIAPIMVDMMTTDDGSESCYTDRSTVVGLLNRYEAKANNQSVVDAIVGIERKLIVLEKIMKEIERVGRTNFKESQEFSRQREYQYLMEIDSIYRKLFSDAYKLINQAKEGLK